MKIILNKCYGGFDVSEEAYRLYAKKKGMDIYKYNYRIASNKNMEYYYAKEDDLFAIYFTKDFGNNKEDDLFAIYFTKDFGNNIEIPEEDYEKYSLYLREDYRTDETLIRVVEDLGEKASGRLSNLKVIEIPDNNDYTIHEYDGIETLYYSDTEIKNA